MGKKKAELELVGEDAATLERVQDAYIKHRAGMTWSQVAQDCGFASAESARISVQKAMKQARRSLDQNALDEMLDMELDRLDALQLAVWPMAMNGDTKSVDAALRVISTRAKFLGFDRREEKVTNQTLVITQDSFVEQLQELVNRGHIDEQGN